MSKFEVYPAVDLRGGQVVRLSQGDPDRQTWYSSDPAQTALRWVRAGSRWLHVINLDGAFGEKSDANFNALQKILDAVSEEGIAVQFGGGIRELSDVERLLEMGVSRVILGTAAVRDLDFAPSAVERFGADAAAVGVDLRQGVLQVEGWQKSSSLSPLEFGRMLRERGLERAVVTDVSRDGMGKGLNLNSSLDYQRDTGLQVIAAGGVSNLEDVLSARDRGLEGVVIGKALYEGNLQLSQVFEILRGGV
jgi:phosphoribosylformimino-5-aminoimidazole carboxamide ribotide isomerase